MTDSPAGISDLIERLQARVAERRAAGDYPPGLEDQLEAHFRRIVFHRAQTLDDEAEAMVKAIESHSSFMAERITLNSGLPGGELIHRAVAKAIARQTAGILSQMQDYADAVQRALTTMVAAYRNGSTHTHADLIGHLDAVIERIDSYERTPPPDSTSPAVSPAAIGDLRRRVEELERAEAARRFQPWFTNGAFEERFRGSKEEIFEQYRSLAQTIAPYSPVMDFGCGRGEFVELLTSMGAVAWGVEIDGSLAQAARDGGHNVLTGDGIAILAAQDDKSLGGLVLLQVIEHLTIQQQLDVVRLGYDKLRVGGKMVVETINPQSLYVYAHSLYVDPTHTRPVHPAYLAFLFEQAGFAEVVWEWRTPPPEQDRLEQVDGDADTPANRNIERLNDLLFASGDYALIVTR